MWGSLAKLLQRNDSKEKAKPGTTFQVRPPNPVPTPEGHVRLKRVSKSNLIKMHYPDGSYVNYVYSKDTQRQWIKLGMNPYKIDDICNYLYNFNDVIVPIRSETDEPWTIWD